METIDDEICTHASDFIDQAAKANKPFFAWFKTTRIHIWTRLKPASVGKTGIGLYPDGMVEHDALVGELLKELDDQGLRENTIVIYSTDNGAETVTWPDGGTTPFHGEKGSTWEGGFRVPCLVRWPGVIQPGTIYNNIMSQEDWMPTLLAAAGVPDVVEKLEAGYTANGKKWRIHPDGYNFLPFFKGEAKTSPRDTIIYFGQGGELNAIRWNDWKVSFAAVQGNIAQGVREITNWPIIVNLRTDPYEKAYNESQLYGRWYADNMWLFVPIVRKVKEFIGSIPQYPFQEGQSLNAGDINYNTLKMAQILKQLNVLQGEPDPLD